MGAGIGNPTIPAIGQNVGPYVTSLSPADEQKFQQWAKQKNPGGWKDSPSSDYDMRGYWLAQQGGDLNAKQASNQHFPDTYKTPYHATFSDESKYAPKDAPAWQGDDAAGYRLIDKNGRIVADEGTPKPRNPLMGQF